MAPFNFRLIGPIRSYMPLERDISSTSPDLVPQYANSSMGSIETQVKNLLIWPSGQSKYFNFLVVGENVQALTALLCAVTNLNGLLLKN